MVVVNLIDKSVTRVLHREQFNIVRYINGECLQQTDLRKYTVSSDAIANAISTVNSRLNELRQSNISNISSCNDAESML